MKRLHYLERLNMMHLTLHFLELMNHKQIVLARHRFLQFFSYQQ